MRSAKQRAAAPAPAAAESDAIGATAAAHQRLGTGHGAARMVAGRRAPASSAPRGRRRRSRSCATTTIDTLVARGVLPRLAALSLARSTTACVSRRFRRRSAALVTQWTGRNEERAGIRPVSCRHRRCRCAAGSGVSAASWRNHRPRAGRARDPSHRLPAACRPGIRHCPRATSNTSSVRSPHRAWIWPFSCVHLPG